MRKSSFLTFCFALIPGAGQMYLGLMKKGISLMTLFMGIIAILGFLRLEVFAFLLPVVWFYAFFDTFNMRNLSDEERKSEDKFILNADQMFDSSLKNKLNGVFSQRHKLLGGIFIIGGIYLLYENLLSSYIYHIFGENEWIYDLINNIPTVIIAFIIIAIGINLIRGGKASNVNLIEKKDDFKEFGGEKDD